jgi:hypothetical protein
MSSEMMLIAEDGKGSRKIPIIPTLWPQSNHVGGHKHGSKDIWGHKHRSKVIWGHKHRSKVIWDQIVYVFRWKGILYIWRYLKTPCKKI